MSLLSQGFRINGERHYLLIDENDFKIYEDKEYFNKSTIKIIVVKGYESNERVEKVSDKEYMFIQLAYRIENYFGDRSGRHLRTKNYICDDGTWWCDGELVKRLPKQIRCAYEESTIV